MNATENKLETQTETALNVLVGITSSVVSQHADLLGVRKWYCRHQKPSA